MTKEQRQIVHLSKQAGQLQGILDWIKMQNVPPEILATLRLLEKSVKGTPRD